MSDPLLTDDYVASILQRDAQREGQSRLFASGLASILGGRTRPRSEAPRPNARFLKNLVRNMDSHNAALKAREEGDSKRRMSDRARDQRRDRGHDRSERRGRRDSLERYSTNDARRRERWDGRERYPIDDSRRRERRRKEDRQRERSLSPTSGDDYQRRTKERRRERSGEPEASGPLKRKREAPVKTYGAATDSDSEPLDSFIGPQPPPVSAPRGRGAANTSSMDARFSSTYDPRVDVSLDPHEEGDDWDMALEALRDRAKWRKSGAERLRAAGFTEEEVDQWESGTGGEKDVGQVRWRKKGERREWDRGKVVDRNHVGLTPEWSRLKDI